ncbi:MAG: hypothetical protein ABL921_14030 [Pirellula sp.]
MMKKKLFCVVGISIMVTGASMVIAQQPATLSPNSVAPSSPISVLAPTVATAIPQGALPVAEAVAVPVTTMSAYGGLQTQYVDSNVVKVYGTAKDNYHLHQLMYSKPTPSTVYRDPSTKRLTSVTDGDKLGEQEKSLVQQHQVELSKAMESLRSSKSSEAEKEAARKLIAEELDIQFNIDLDQRREQLAKIEKEVSELRDQLRRRQDSKAKLIDLRMQLLENESDGLGFPSTWNDLESKSKVIAPSIRSRPVQAR